MSDTKKNNRLQSNAVTIVLSLSTNCNCYTILQRALQNISRRRNYVTLVHSIYSVAQTLKLTTHPKHISLVYIGPAMNVRIQVTVDIY